MSHLSTLLSVRRQSFSRQFATFGALGWTLVGIIVLGAAALGYALTPALADGDIAIDAAFWLSCAALSITSFRCMDLMFRVESVRALDHLPLDLGALYWDRLLSILFDALLYAIPITALLIPLVVADGDGAAVGSIALAFVGLPASSIAAMVVYLYIGGRVSGGRLDEAGGGGSDADMYGGPGGLLLYAPGIALAGALIALVGMRLGIRATLQPDAPPDVLGVVWSIGGFILLGILVYGHHGFVADFIPIRARFREADAMSFDVDLDYQDSVFESEVRGERWAPPSIRPLVRAFALQYNRRHLLVRYGFPAAAVVSGLAMFRLGPEDFPIWAAAAVPAILIGTAGNPWRRLNAPEFQPNVLDALPFDENQRHRAASLQAAREVTYAVASYVVVVFPATWLGADLLSAALVAMAAVGLCGFLAVIVDLTMRAHRSAANWVPPVAAALGTAAAYLSAWISALFGVLVILLVVASAFRHPSQ